MNINNEGVKSIPKSITLGNHKYYCRMLYVASATILYPYSATGSNNLCVHYNIYCTRGYQKLYSFKV